MRLVTTLVGREADLAVLVNEFDGAADGSTATVLIGGEAGIGKTRLVQAFAARVADRARVLVGGCVERGAEGLPFAPFTAALRGLASSLGPAGVAELLPLGKLGELPRLLPGLSELKGETDTGSASARLFEQVLMLLGALATQRPTVLVIEDAHWADSTSRALLDFLVRNQRAAPALLIVVTYRSDELELTHPLRAMLAELDRVSWVTRRELGRLSRRDVAAQVQGILAREPTPDLVDDLYRRSDGNPLFVEALLANRASEGGAALPQSLRDLLLAPILRLPDDARQVVRAAAVGGLRVGHDLLASVAGLEDGPLSAALRAAVAGNALVVDGESYAFRHALIRDAVYAEQLPGERVRAHLRYAEPLEANPALAPDGRAAAELAHHWYAARDLPRALNAAWRAAAEAEASLAYSEQLHLLSRVLELWPQVNAPADRVGSSRLGVLERAAHAAWLAGEAEQGVTLATSALSELDDQPARAARMLELRSGMRQALGRDGDLDDLREAVRLAPVDDPSRARVLAALATRLLDVPQHDEARLVADEALDLARRFGDARTEVLALVVAATVRARFGQLATELPRLHKAQRIAEAIGANDRLMRAIHAEAQLLEAYGQHERAVEVARRGIAAATETGMARSLAGPHIISAASSLISLGRWDEALQTIDAGLQSAPPPIVRAELTCQRALIGLARGDAELPRNAIAIARDVSDAGANIVFPMIELEISLLLQDKPTDALTVVERALADHDVQASSRFGWPFLVLAARTAGEAPGDVHTPALLAELQVQAEKMPVATPVQQAHQITFAAETARAQGRPGRAAWAAASAAWDDLHQPYRLANALLGAAEAAITVDNDRAAATELIRRAVDLADALSAVPLRAAIDRLVRRARLPVASAEAGTDDPIEQVRARLGLTSRELEVLRLVATGRNNHDIAAELFISAKTVSVHVSRILAKLGLANRTEAAATAHRLGLD
jgi:DNA-binding CsgD family transcriptional regulator